MHNLLPPKKSNKFKYYKLDELRPEDATIHDVLNALNRMLAQIKIERYYALDMMPQIAIHFEPGGVAESLPITLDTFKVAVHFLEICRNEVDCRVMKFYWPLFHQLYLHVNFTDLDAVVGYFFSNEKLQGTGPAWSLHKIAKMENSFPNFNSEFEAAQQFIIKDPLSPVDDEYRRKCQHLCFYLMFHPRRFVKILTTEAMRFSTKNPDSIHNLLQLFRLVPSLIMHEIPMEDDHQNNNSILNNSDSFITLNAAKLTEPLAVALIRRIFNFELTSMQIQLKRVLLDQIVDGLTKDFRFQILEEIVCPPLLDRSSFDGLYDYEEQGGKESQSPTTEYQYQYGQYSNNVNSQIRYQFP